MALASTAIQKMKAKLPKSSKIPSLHRSVDSSEKFVDIIRKLDDALTTADLHKSSNVNNNENSSVKSEMKGPAPIAQHKKKKTEAREKLNTIFPEVEDQMNNNTTTSISVEEQEENIVMPPEYIVMDRKGSKEFTVAEMSPDKLPKPRRPRSKIPVRQECCSEADNFKNIDKDEDEDPKFVE